MVSHPAFVPIVKLRARIDEMAHEPRLRKVMSQLDSASGERNAAGLDLPHTRED